MGDHSKCESQHNSTSTPSLDGGREQYLEDAYSAVSIANGPESMKESFRAVFDMQEDSSQGVDA